MTKQVGINLKWWEVVIIIGIIAGMFLVIFLFTWDEMKELEENETYIQI